ncbi:hypothetical protein XENORESO_007962 [Xenotaenia resolanae]|uniref:Uncharacterized protein n=1 Tax=Xenotaenia resolanae TaxID=208358 RepID=A0ABV0X806_9TELE
MYQDYDLKQVTISELLKNKMEALEHPNQRILNSELKSAPKPSSAALSVRCSLDLFLVFLFSSSYVLFPLPATVSLQSASFGPPALCQSVSLRHLCHAPYLLLISVYSLLIYSVLLHSC